jgi:hypothetical protein
LISLLYKRLLQLGKVAGTLTFLFGIPYGLWQYFEKQHESRVEQSLRLFDKFNTPPMTTYRERINKVVADNRASLEEAAPDAKAYAVAINRVVEKNDTESSLWLIMDFFDGVVICVTNHICDAETIDQLFAARADDIYITFYQYIVLHRKGPRSTFALGLETIATNRRALERREGKPR